jgi:hypothetical protein
MLRDQVRSLFLFGIESYKCSKGNCGDYSALFIKPEVGSIRIKTDDKPLIGLCVMGPHKRVILMSTRVLIELAEKETISKTEERLMSTRMLVELS